MNINKLCIKSNPGHVVLIGNGISGVTCARHIRKKRNDLRITIISAESEHFFSRTALMYVYMGQMKQEHLKPYEDFFWQKNSIDLVHDRVQHIDTTKKALELESGKTVVYDALVIASGSTPNKFGWPGQDLTGVQGFYSLQDLQNMEANTKNIQRAVIVGGGLIGIEMAEMLHSRHIPVTFLVREPNFWGSVLPEEEARMINRHILEHGIDLRTSTELKEIKADQHGRVKEIVTNKDETIPCEFVGLTVGVHPNISFLENSGIEVNKGILVNEYFETNVHCVYAIGDCAEFRTSVNGRKTIEQVWYTGRMHGETLANTICGNKTAYTPGNWFNSAKFFDIEYQTYGWVWAKPKENENTFYWEHPGGKISFRAVYEKGSDVILAFNVFGMRLRHEICDRWINEKRTLNYVLEHLYEANFDPELYANHDTELIAKYNQENGTKLFSLRKRSLIGKLLFG